VHLVWLDNRSNHEIFYTAGSPPNYEGPNFQVKGSEPFRRNVTAGYTEMTDNNGVLHRYAVVPVELYDKHHPDKNQWVITVKDFHTQPRFKATDGAIDYWMRIRQTNMKQTPIWTNYLDPWATDSAVDPLVKRTFTNNPDMDQRFTRFVQGDLSALSDKGIVLLTFIDITPDHIFE